MTFGEFEFRENGIAKKIRRLLKVTHPNGFFSILGMVFGVWWTLETGTGHMDRSRAKCPGIVKLHPAS